MKDKIKNIAKIFWENFRKSETMTLANNLTYVSLFSIFPFIAILIGFSKGFGLDIFLTNRLKEFIPNSSSTVAYLLNTAQNLMNSLSSNVLSGIGIIIILWAIIALLQQIEESFNRIWNVNSRRNYERIFMNYIAIIFLTPIIIVILIATNDKLIEFVSLYTPISILVILVAKGSKFVILVLFFTLMYYKIPNTKVKISSSFISSFLVVIVLAILSNFIQVVQSTISKYNAIYGSLSFIPLFLLWVKYLWVLILSGAQISYSLDTNYTIDDKALSLKYQKELSLYILYNIIKRFEDDKEPYTLEELSSELGIKKYVVRICLNILCELGYVNSSNVLDEDLIKFQVNKNPNIINIRGFVEDFESTESIDIDIFVDNESREKFQKIESLLEIQNNLLVKEIDIK